MTSDEKIAQLAAAVDEETKARLGAPQTHPEFDRLIRTIWRLRQEDGCPWDKEQTHQSISKNMIEEAYEAVEAIAEDSPEHLEEELGDVLEQVVLHAQIEADSGAAGFDIDDVCRALNQKLAQRRRLQLSWTCGRVSRLRSAPVRKTPCTPRVFSTRFHSLYLR